MVTLFRVGAVLFLLCSMGCSGWSEQSGKPGNPKAVEAFEAHLAALRLGDWRAAYEQLHPDLRAVITLKKFTAFHSRRRKSVDLPQVIEVVSAESSGQHVTLSFDALYAQPGGGSPIVVPPRRKVTLRKSGTSWNLMTHDVLAIAP